MPPSTRALALLLPLTLSSCAKPQSIELGAACKEQVECKAPADTCLTLNGELLCTVACSADDPCPTGYACAKMDVRVEGEGGAEKAGAQGYCLAKSRVASHVVTIAPKDDAAPSKASKASKKRRAAE